VDSEKHEVLTMRISGFSFARNVVKLHYPIKEAILSILPIVDEFVIALAEGDPDDTTREMVESIEDPRIRIVEGTWEVERLRSRAYSHMTNVALDECSGDWCFYIQADEVVHEDDLPIIRARCEQLLDDRRVEGLLFDYLHFFGDYDHYQTSHGWYQKEIRIIRSGLGIRSVRDAQSFRYADESRIDVARVDARIFHYGWVRPPDFMHRKRMELFSHSVDRAALETEWEDVAEIDYGPMGRLPVYAGTHPAVMRDRIAEMDWADKLRQKDAPGMTRRERHQDERPKCRILSAIERWSGLDLNHKNYGKVIRV
jgi:glycosyltransferase involved in cell wall biosynthesis